MENQLEPHQQRVVDEHKEVREKTSKLGTFILDNPTYQNLPEEEREDMKIQYDAMCIYCDALERRIKRF